jgi:hypothetical protein
VLVTEDWIIAVASSVKGCVIECGVLMRHQVEGLSAAERSAMKSSAFQGMNDTVRHSRAYAAARMLENAARSSIAYAVARHGIACAKELIGANSKFCIRGAYQHRAEVSYFDDTNLADEYPVGGLSSGGGDCPQ